MNTDEVRKRFEVCMKDQGANFERLARGEPYSNTYIYVQQAFEGFEMGYQQGIKDSEDRIAELEGILLEIKNEVNCGNDSNSMDGALGTIWLIADEALKEAN